MTSQHEPKFNHKHFSNFSLSCSFNILEVKQDAEIPYVMCWISRLDHCTGAKQKDMIWGFCYAFHRRPRNKLVNVSSKGILSSTIFPELTVTFPPLLCLTSMWQLAASEEILRKKPFTVELKFQIHKVTPTPSLNINKCVILNLKKKWMRENVELSFNKQHQF